MLGLLRANRTSRLSRSATLTRRALALGRCLYLHGCLGHLPLLPGLPLRECGLITVERFVVEIEYTGIATAVTAIVEIGLHGRHRLRVVTE
ncbi:hypothetical protein B0G83_106203 [Paraburkholderia sp. BL21I4N1]|nr:hypothetical protein B0G83_106203 [Paraburkholderia sp. BL21I4N1]